MKQTDAERIKKVAAEIQSIWETDASFVEQGLLLSRMYRNLSSTTECDTLCVIADRIVKAISSMDDPRYTVEDYADAVTFLPVVSSHLDDLTKISNEDFMDVIVDAAGVYRHLMSDGMPLDWTNSATLEKKIAEYRERSMANGEEGSLTRKRTGLLA